MSCNSNLHVSSTTSGTQIVNSSDFGSKPDATGAVDASGHDGFDKRTDVLVFNATFTGERVVGET